MIEHLIISFLKYLTGQGNNHTANIKLEITDTTHAWQSYITNITREHLLFNCIENADKIAAKNQ